MKGKSNKAGLIAKCICELLDTILFVTTVAKLENRIKSADTEIRLLKDRIYRLEKKTQKETEADTKVKDDLMTRVRFQVLDVNKNLPGLDVVHDARMLNEIISGHVEETKKRNNNWGPIFELVSANTENSYKISNIIFDAYSSGGIGIKSAGIISVIADEDGTGLTYTENFIQVKNPGRYILNKEAESTSGYKYPAQN